MHNDSKTIIGLGSALVDILIHETDDFIEQIKAPKGGMMLVEEGVIDTILAKSAASPVIVPGGSACNTVTGIAQLGGSARFVGKSGVDSFGNLLETDLTRTGVSPYLFKSETPTGRVLSVITPDAQRTMLTHLGAAEEMKPEEMTDACFSDAQIVHVEGYLLFNPDLLLAALKTAKKAGARISLDLASYTVVNAAKSHLDTIIPEYIDILIANEDEAQAFTDISDESEALNRLAENVEIAVLKLGKHGSIIAADGRHIPVAPHGDAPVVDTTGAGDLWAAGFLYGLTHGHSLEISGALASACGYEVCRVVGAAIPGDGWERIAQHLKNIQ